MIPESDISNLLERVDIVDVIGAHVALKKAGANFVGLCPFHNEGTPSFSVSPSKQFFHCFGCGKSGDAIKFLQEHLGSGFREAVQDLAQKYGVSINEEQTPEQAARAQSKQKLVGTNEKAQSFFSRWLKDASAQNAKVREYVKRRGISSEMVDRFGLGYAPAGSPLLGLCGPQTSPKHEASARALVEAGLVYEEAAEGAHTSKRPARHDRFRDRLMFPIHDSRGALVGFGGRALRDDQQPKYLNSPETDIFEKKRILYGMHLAAKSIAASKSIWVVEGYMDVIAMHQAGITNSVAALGTAFSEDHGKAIARAAEVVYFLFDGDGAGRKAAWRAATTMLPLLKPSLRCHFVTVAGAKDADEYLKKASAEDLIGLGQSAPTLGQYIFDCLDEKIDIQTPEGKANYAAQAKELIALLPKDSALRRPLYEMLDARLGRGGLQKAVTRSIAFIGTPSASLEMLRLLEEKDRVKAILQPGAKLPSSLRAYKAEAAAFMVSPAAAPIDQDVIELIVRAIDLAPRCAMSNDAQIRFASRQLASRQDGLRIERALDALEANGVRDGAPDDREDAVDLLERFPAIASAMAAPKNLLPQDASSPSCA